MKYWEELNNASALTLLLAFLTTLIATREGATALTAVAIVATAHIISVLAFIAVSILKGH